MDFLNKVSSEPQRKNWTELSAQPLRSAPHFFTVDDPATMSTIPPETSRDIDSRRLVQLHPERVTNVSSTDYPGHYTGEEGLHGWDLSKFKEVRAYFLIFSWHFLAFHLLSIWTLVELNFIERIGLQCHRNPSLQSFRRIRPRRSGCISCECYPTCSPL